MAFVSGNILTPIEPRIWEVAALVQAIDDAMGLQFGAVGVQGELSGFNRAASGHCYFTLKSRDGQAGLRCAMFRRAATLVDFAPRDGMAVELRGRLTVYGPRGDLQLVVEGMRRAGVGALMEQYLRLKARLEAEGLFDPARKRAVPTHPRRVGVVTSLAAAALHDVLTALQRRAPHVSVVVYPAPVQGADAAARLAEAIGQAARRAEVDTLLVCRGGGSIEDLWAFNDERVVRAVATAPMPVISGVGHETDVTLCDFAADLRAPTPTAAAELAAPARDECLAALASLAARLQRRMHHRLDRDALALDHLVQRWRRPSDWLRVQRQQLQHREQRLGAALPRGLAERESRWADLAARLWRAERGQRDRAHQALAVHAARLQALDPARVLARGYAWLIDGSDHAVVSVDGVAVGQSLTAVLADGRIETTVQHVQRKAPGDA